MIRFARILAIASITALAGQVDRAFCQFDAPKSVVLDGPAGYRVRVSVTASKELFGEQESTQTTSNLELASEPIRLKLDEAYSAFRVAVFSPTKQKVKVQLMEGDEVVEEVTSEKPGTVQVVLGNPPDGNKPLPAALLKREESRLIALLHQTLSKGSSVAPLVSENTAAAIDTTQLSNFFQEVVRSYGGPKANPNGMLDGWLAWDGASETRLLYGPYFFGQESKPQFLSLMLVDNQIVDLEFDADLLPDPWLAKVEDTTQYEAQSLAFAEAIFSGRSLDAESMLGENLRQRSDPGKLAGLSQKIRRQYGVLLSSKEQDVDLQSFDQQQQRYLLTVRHRFEMSGQRPLVGSFAWEIPSVAGSVGRGELLAFDFYEPWSHKDPDTRIQALRILNDLISNVDETELDVSDIPLWKELHPRIKAWSSRNKVEALTRTCRRRLGGVMQPFELDNWFCRGKPGSVFVGGVIHCSQSGRTSFEMQFADGFLVNLKIAADDFAASTAGLVSDDLSSIVDRGEEFWRAALAGQFEKAFAMLSTGFRKQLSVEQFEQMLPDQSLRLIRLEKAGPFVWDSTARQLPCMLTSYYLATFEDDSVTCFRTRWGIVTGGASVFDPASIELIGFSSDFIDRVFHPLESPHLSLLSALKDQDLISLKSLAAESYKDQMLDPVLKAAITTAGITSEMPLEEHSRLVRSYSGSRKSDSLQTVLSDEDQLVKLNANFVNNELVSLEIRTFETSNERLSEVSIAQQLIESELLGQRGKKFLQLWADTSFEPALNYVAADIRSEEALQGLTELLNSLKVEHGLLTNIVLTDTVATKEPNEMQLNYQLQFADFQQDVELTFLFDTATAEIVKIKF